MLIDVFIVLWFRFQRYGKKQYHETFLKIFFILFFYSVFPYICIKSKNKQMEKLKPGRKKIPADQRVKLVSAYLKNEDKAAIVKKYGSLTKAVKLLIIPSLYR